MVTKKQMKIKTGLRTASKVQEKQIVAAGKWLAEHPESVIPKCEVADRRCDFSKLESKISYISENSGDKALLARMAKHGDQLVRAYAASLLVALEGKAAYLVVARGSAGDVAFAYSAKVKREPLIGLQYFRDPHLRLFAYAHLSKKRKVTFFATKESVFCTPQGGKVPQKFIEETAARLNLPKRDKSGFTCGHNLEELGYLEVHFEPDGPSLRICQKCLTDEKTILPKIVSRVLTKNPLDLLSIHAFVRLDCRTKCEKCPTGNMYEFEYDEMDKYIKGEITDKKMYELAIQNHLSSAGRTDEKIYVIGQVCFGDDPAAFAEALSTTPAEREALAALLRRLKPPVIVQGNMTPNKFLAQHWTEHGPYLMKELIGHETEKAPELADNVTPMMVIDKARSARRASQIHDSLPKYKSLGKHSSFVDRIIRSYKSSGVETALRLTVPTGTEDTHQRSIGLAFRIAMGETGIEWQYTKEEIGHAKHLSASARTLLEAEGEEYDLLLRQFIRNAGVQDEIVRK